ncbi:CRISPR-associated helicase Cas3' [Clostridioides sp. ZZV14-6009]|uniref:CRISPR-associated helicase Cas3' n=2 Tax=Clostridioides TaxID=1870884 RepID=UPI001D103B7A|nr:CRISPR-associated helicase Cas3' [Clostridioides sp. ZZV14-6153]MCC0728893.1 CRISPR-associated helicase Cas3' [Clostridioides sp. ZZV14-6045]MCC0733603.1 CRISPR-associated helicase Cas3' [Clostridioides sp. ZZV14-6009]
MYFEKVELFDINSNVNNYQNIYAHINKDKSPETLKEHSDLVYSYFMKLCIKRDLESCLKRIEDKFFKNNSYLSKDFYRELMLNMVYMHDLGKINVSFQSVKMNNKNFKSISTRYTKHSFISSILYFDYYFEKLKKADVEEKKLLKLFLMINTYVISKHHGVLKSFREFLSSFENEFINIEDNFKDLFIHNYNLEIKSTSKTIKKIISDTYKYLDDSFIKDGLDIDLYIYSKLMFAIITSCDFYATSEYNSGKSIDDFGTIDNHNKYYDVFKKSKIYENMNRYREYLNNDEKCPYEDNDINKLRTEMSIEAEETMTYNLSKNIFYLEAPTGSGKTVTSINLALKFIELNQSLIKIFYIFPFNTLIEQTKSIFINDLFNSVKDIEKDVVVINSITPIQTYDEEEDNKDVKEYSTKQKIDYEKSLLNKQFLHYPIVLTTNIGFFNYLFGVSREESFPLIHMINSVVILDEIQSYKNEIWKEIILFLEKYAEILNIKIIIMSATLPRLNKLGCNDDNFAYLVRYRDKYFKNPLFKDRVNISFEMLNSEVNSIEEIVKKVVEESERYNKILIEFIKKSSALKFYKNIKEKLKDKSESIYLITGDDNKLERKKIINKIKDIGSVILVATQVVEAGVDIDMDLGFKDISIIDSDEQFLGRINRSCKKLDSKVYFFNLDDAKEIYRKDIRKEKNLTLNEESNREIILEKDFEKYYDKIIARIEENKNKHNDENIDVFTNDIVGKLDFKSVNERMTLIDKLRDYTIFLNTQVEDESGNIVVGSDVWEDYVSLLKNNDIEYSEKRVKMSDIMEKLDYFTYKLRKFDNSFNDYIGDIFYIDDGEQYFTDGKFDRSKFNENVEHEYI